MRGSNEPPSILSKAQGLTGQELARVLDEECGEDQALRAEVEKRLEFESQAEEAPEKTLPVSTRLVGELTGLPEGYRVGRYRVEREIGRGGMAAVYLAQQLEPVRRLVALKFMARGFDAKDAVARFKAEQQAIALMSHTSIANVYDAGVSEDGLPYFAMNFVSRGNSLVLSLFGNDL